MERHRIIRIGDNIRRQNDQSPNELEIFISNEQYISNSALIPSEVIVSDRDIIVFTFMISFRVRPRSSAVGKI